MRVRSCAFLANETIKRKLQSQKLKYLYTRFNRIGCVVHTFIYAAPHTEHFFLLESVDQTFAQRYWNLIFLSLMFYRMAQTQA